MKLKRFQVQNYMRFEETEWINVNDVTALVGGNESCKTALLKALWKLKPGRENIVLDAQAEFPRRKYTTEFLRTHKERKWPVVNAEFQLDQDDLSKLIEIDPNFKNCDTIICTSFYDHAPEIEILKVNIPKLSEEIVQTALKQMLDLIAEIDPSTIEPVAIPNEGDETPSFKNADQILAEFKVFIEDIYQKIGADCDFENEENIKLMFSSFMEHLNFGEAHEWKKDFKEKTSQLIKPFIDRPTLEEKLKKAKELVWELIPIFVYFDDYNLLDSKIHMPATFKQITSTSLDPKTRSQWALFQIAGFPIEEIIELAFSTEDPSDILTDDAKEIIFKEVSKRSILASSSAIGVTDEFAEWWIQARHIIHFNVDGEFFQLWVSDDKYPALIEFEGRSQGFRWFFTFYVVFMAETDYKHKDAILLLDEPGLHLYIPQQEKLLELFDKIADSDQILYSTHSPFMLDPRHLERVRVLDELDDGSIIISEDTGRSGDDVVFPIQAILGYTLAQTLFLARRVLIVEGETDYQLLIFLSDVLKEQNRVGLPNQMAISFAGGNSSIRPLLAMMAPQGFEIVVLLDSDESGEAVGKSLEEKGYRSLPNVDICYIGKLLEFEDYCDIESIIPEEQYHLAVQKTHKGRLSKKLTSSKKKTLSKRIKEWLAERQIKLNKRKVIQWIIDQWRTGSMEIPESTLNNAEKIFKAINEIIEEINRDLARKT